MKEKIIQFLKKNPYAMPADIYQNFNQKRQEIAVALQTLENEGLVIFEDQHYVLPETLGLLVADIVSIKDHYAFAKFLDSEEEVRIEEEQLADALLMDRVYLRYRYVFRVVKIVRRGYEQIVGEIHQGKGFVELLTQHLAPINTIFLVQEGKAEDGDIVLAKIIKSHPHEIDVKIEKVLGQKNAPGMDITRWILEHDAPIEFSKETEIEVLRLPMQVKEEECLHRLDLRKELIYTIDGEDARDLDDAVSIQKTESGYRIGVHIADVSYYVASQSAIDQDAFSRGTSIYVTDRVVPMLPFSLSNGICSLNPNEDRLTISCLIEINENGEVISSSIRPSVIHSHHRLTYTYVNEVIHRHQPQNALEENLLLLYEASQKIRFLREKNGALDLNVPEVKIIVDSIGTPIDIEKKIQHEGEKVIEDLMILSNEAVANTINRRHLPFLYRIHENPRLQKLEQFISFSSRLGYPPSFSPLKVTPLDLQQHILPVLHQPEGEILSAVLLRSLAKARYSEQNKGHFGLASPCYTHFTSPIRRYPDLIVHRLIRKYLFEEDFSHLSELEAYLNYAAEETSLKERRAIAIERECIDHKGAEYMENHLGEEMEGYIEGMNTTGLFVQLDNGLSGCLKFEDFHDYFYLDEHNHTAFSRRKGLRFLLGERVKVIIIEADKNKGQITLGYSSNNYIKRPAPSKKYRRGRR